MPTIDPYNWTAYADYSYYEYDCEDVEDSDYCVSDFYYSYNDYEEKFDEILDNVGNIITFHLAIVSIILNILHLLILSQKQLRSTAIFIFMIGVALSDISSFSFSFSWKSEPFYLEPLLVEDEERSFCFPDKWVPIDIFGQFISTGHGLTRRTSVWLALIMALLRTISIMFPMSNGVQKMTTSGKAIFISIVIFVISFITETWQLILYSLVSRIEELLPNSCPKSQQKEYVIVVPEKTMLGNDREILIVEIYLKLTPAFLYPILTILLFFELRKVQKRRNNMRSNSENHKSDNTVTLIFVMTLSFMVTEVSFGIGSFFKLTWSEWSFRDSFDTFRFINLILFQATAIFRSLNAISHPIVCTLLSSQYRETVKSMFCSNRISRKVAQIIKIRSLKKTDTVDSQVSPTIQS